MGPVEHYLTELAAIRSTGANTDETSYYTPLANLLNEIGKSLKPKVRCVMGLKDQGAGMPDGGLFTPDQFQKASAGKPLPGQIPSRGVIEAKPTRDDAWVKAKTEQVSRYWERYRQVLVTNYRDFLLLGEKDGHPAKVEHYRLADNEAAFWEATRNPRVFARAHEVPLREFLTRVIRHAASITEPKDVAWFLASYARHALARVEHANDTAMNALASVRKDLQEALGLKFEGEKGEHFFRSSLVQTLFYGVFSAWVIWHRENPGSRQAFRWQSAAYSLRVPMMVGLYSQIAQPNRLGALGLGELLDSSEMTLNRVVPDAFFRKFQHDYAIQYFYEPFLEEFDPLLRKELGVWYTPREIVKYMVARVDTVLREELDIEDGLADPRVYVLDPCCGTGTYLLEVLDRIERTLKEKGLGTATAGKVRDAAMHRVFGFEILPAPFVISHMQIGLKLSDFGASLSAKQRAAVYLTNALTGWEPPKTSYKKIPFSLPELEEERDAAEHVKRDTPILVILGNPPYNAFAGTSPEEEGGLVDVYKEGLVKEWGIKKFNLDDLYIRFFRLAERRIVERTGEGVVCFISSFSYLGGDSYVVMRKRLLEGFHRLWFDSLNGDSRETGKLTPEGNPDPSVFSTEHNREGIRVGTTIGLLVRKKSGPAHHTVDFRQFWGATKRADLLASLDNSEFNAQYKNAKPTPQNRYSFRPGKVSKDYLAWPKLTDLARVPPYNGPIERRGLSLIVMQADRSKLDRVRQYLDRDISDIEMASIAPEFMKSSGEFDANHSRGLLKGEVKYDPKSIQSYAFKPFDIRVAYLSPEIQPLFSRPSPNLLSQSFAGNRFFISRDSADKTPEGPPFYFSSLVCDYDFISGHARHIPILIKSEDKEPKKHGQSSFELGDVDVEGLVEANLAMPTRNYLRAILAKDSSDEAIAPITWNHALAIGYSPNYLSENTDGIRRNWPRIPLPNGDSQLKHSVQLGKTLSDLLDTETQIKGVTSAPIRAELKIVATLAGRPPPGEIEENAITVGWGHGGQGGVTMPGRGRLQLRAYSADERAAIEQGAKTLGLTAKAAFEQLGKQTYDVYLNDGQYWRNIPENAWDYVIGGYQVVKKWLSYREHSLLGRPLTTDEVLEVMNMARRICAILLLQPALDANYQAIKADAFDWGSLTAEDEAGGPQASPTGP